jgi:hypothetical protein
MNGHEKGDCEAAASGAPSKITDADLSKAASWIRSGARVAYENEATCSVRISIVGRLDECKQTLQIGGMPGARNKRGVLIDVYVAAHDSIRAVLSDPIRAELEPFIIGVGHVLTHDTAEGFEVVLRDCG